MFLCGSGRFGLPCAHWLGFGLAGAGIGLFWLVLVGCLGQTLLVVWPVWATFGNLLAGFGQLPGMLGELLLRFATCLGMLGELLLWFATCLGVLGSFCCVLPSACECVRSFCCVLPRAWECLGSFCCVLQGVWECMCSFCCVLPRVGGGVVGPVGSGRVGSGRVANVPPTQLRNQRPPVDPLIEISNFIASRKKEMENIGASKSGGNEIRDLD